jgi:hypothetical protein
MANGNQFVSESITLPIEEPPSFLKLPQYVDIDLSTAETFPPRFLQYGVSSGALLPLFYKPSPTYSPLGETGATLNYEQKRLQAGSAGLNSREDVAYKSMSRPPSLSQGETLYCQVGAAEGYVIEAPSDTDFAKEAGQYAPQSYFGGEAAKYYCRLPAMAEKNMTLPTTSMFASFDGVLWYEIDGGVKQVVSPSMTEIIPPPGLIEG